MLIEVAERAGAGATRIAAGAASSTRAGRRALRPLGGHGEDAELRAQLPAFAFGAPGFITPEDQRFKLMLALLADVLKNRHDFTPVKRTALLKSFCGNLAN